VVGGAEWNSLRAQAKCVERAGVVTLAAIVGFPRRGASGRGGDTRRFMVSKAVAVAGPGADRPLLVELAAVPHLSDRAIRAG
jgi:hypothetical protein